MLSVPTLWTVFIINFLALGLIWAYVMRSYPSFDAARFWTGSAFAAAVGASLASLRIVVDSLLPLLAGGTVLMATHNDDVVTALRKRVVALEDGRVIRDEVGGIYHRVD